MINFWISILAFIICLGAAKLIVKTRYFCFLEERGAGRYETLDGLRGFLALAVFFHHFVITYYWKVNDAWVRPPENYYENYGKVGVALFFMITGFLFVSKLLHARGGINWIKLYESRVFRIFPLYIFAIICITFVVFSVLDYQVNESYMGLLKQYIRWLLFIGGDINGYDNTRIIISKVDWTLKYEWLFYLFLPAIYLVINLGGRWASTLLVFACVLLFIEPVLFIFFTTKYFILFAVGGVAAWTTGKSGSKLLVLKGRLSSCVAVLLISGALFYPVAYDFFHVACSTYLLCILFGSERMRPLWAIEVEVRKTVR